MDHPRLAVLNDTHLGTIRTAGTTIASALALRDNLQADFADDLDKIDCDLLINGDLFDKENIPLRDLLTAYTSLSKWLARGHKLWLSPGNHDLSKTSSNFSSFEFLGKMLKSGFPAQVTYIADLTEIYPGYWVLPHLPNQDLLNNRLAKVPECQALFVHTNYDNNFAAQSDQSLNISREQALACKAEYIVFGHEHQTRTALEGKVIIPGNQTASSVADCLGTVKNTKFMVRFELGVPNMHVVRELAFTEMDWQNLAASSAEFIRVTGEASPEQGSQVAQAISRYRSASQAYVITNAVKMLADGDRLEEFSNSLEGVQAFDVMAALKELLEPEEVKALEKLYAE